MDKITKDNLQFINNNPRLNIKNIDVTKDGHLKKVTWFGKLIRALKNFRHRVDKEVSRIYRITFEKACAKKLPRTFDNELDFYQKPEVLEMINKVLMIEKRVEIFSTHQSMEKVELPPKEEKIPVQSKPIPPKKKNVKEAIEGALDKRYPPLPKEEQIPAQNEPAPPTEKNVNEEQSKPVPPKKKNVKEAIEGALDKRYPPLPKEEQIPAQNEPAPPTEKIVNEEQSLKDIEIPVQSKLIPPKKKNVKEAIGEALGKRYPPLSKEEQIPDQNEPPPTEKIVKEEQGLKETPDQNEPISVKAAKEELNLKDIESELNKNGFLDELRANIHDPQKRGSYLIKLREILCDYTVKYSIDEIAEEASKIINIPGGKEGLKRSISEAVKERVVKDPIFFDKLSPPNQNALDPNNERALKQGLNMLLETDLDFEEIVLTFENAWGKIKKYQVPEQGVSQDVLNLIDSIKDKIEKAPQVNLNTLPSGTISKAKDIWKSITNHLNIDYELQIDTSKLNQNDQLHAFLMQYLGDDRFEAISFIILDLPEEERTIDNITKLVHQLYPVIDAKKMKEDFENYKDRMG